MKKVLFVFTLVLSVVLIGCSSNDDENYTPSFTDKQKEALNVLHGNFKDVTYSTYDYRINFEKQYNEPVEFKDSEGKYITSAHGECIYFDDGKPTSCYFNLKSDASVIYLRYRGGEKDKEYYKAFDLYITNKDEFKLFGNLTLPYIYIKDNK